ncbi:Hypothetical_protein [Hexamita inflata]|uniref:Hypothetical_protein n=1 Tax=Hexamita inflata TaxID=28002 RepID=A0AA86UYX1_9EUKA|nr:Hypothetical protein HINF_LOCUS40848 [Hexamita inflata]
MADSQWKWQNICVLQRGFFSKLYCIIICVNVLCLVFLFSTNCRLYNTSISQHEVQTFDSRQICVVGSNPETMMYTTFEAKVSFQNRNEGWNQSLNYRAVTRHK